MPNNIVDTYLQHVNDSIRKYGEKSIVFLECGSFYEIYDNVPTVESKHLQCCENVLGILVTRKNKTDPKSPYMAGIPTQHIRRYNKMLLQHNYTIVFVGQKGETPNITREVVQVMSPGCNLSEEVHESTDIGQSVLMTILLEEDDDGECYAHLATFDTNCGTTHLESIVCDEEKIDMENLLATVQDTLHIFLFHELCVFTNNVSERSKRLVHTFGDKWKDMCKLVHHTCIRDQHLEYVFQRSFQEQFLEKVFSNHVSIFQSIWEALSLQCTEGSCVATLVLLLHWVKLHDTRLVQYLQKPKSHQPSVLYNVEQTESTQEHMICYNELYAKLDIFEDTQDSSHHTTDSRSLFAMLNKTRTKMGERLLQQRLKRAIRDKSSIEQRYEMVSALLDEDGKQGNDTYDVIQNHLNCIDLERMYRRFSLGQLQPKDIPRILQSQTNVIVILQHILSLPEINVLNRHLKEKKIIVQTFETYQKQLFDVFDEEKCTNVNLANVSDTLFHTGHYHEIDKSIQHLYSLKNSVEELAQALMNCVPKMKLSGNQSRWIHIKFNEKDGHWLDVSKNRYKILKDTLGKMSKTDKLQLENTLPSSFIWSIDDLDFNTNNKTNVKISSPQLRSLSFKVQKAQQHIINQVKTEYTKRLIQFYNQYYNQIIEPIVEYIAILDVAFSTAHNTIHNGYVRPQIVEDKHSSFNATALRHPLIEQLLYRSGKHDPYVPNDVKLSHKSCWLLHGVNSVGKSSLLKSIAIAVIMAQAGMYVAASSFTLSPYHKIFARTGNDDNIHVAHSSFVKEMTEARYIIEHSDQHSLVIADELCASTELDSAVHIVGALLQLLSQRQVSFAFATHLFALQEHPFVSQLVERKILKNFHLKVRFENKHLLFDRTLTEGLPINRAYGVLVADKVIQNKAFTELLVGAQKVISNKHQSYFVSNISSTNSSNTRFPRVGNSSQREHTQLDVCPERITSYEHKLTQGNMNVHYRSPKPSRYNKTLWMEECVVCKYCPLSNYDIPLDTHHIIEQHQANRQTGLIEHRFHKNQKHNLVSLCKNCHQKIDTGELRINGYVSSTNGAQLDWSTISQQT